MTICFRRMRQTAAFGVVLLAANPVVADVLLLKSGQRIEGSAALNGAVYEVKTSYGPLNVPKAEVERLVPSVEKITADAEAAHGKAKALFQEALAVQNDPKACNAKLKSALGLLDKVIGSYSDAREVYTDVKQETLDKALLLLMQEKRLYRERLTSEEPIAAAPATAKPAESPGEKKATTPPAPAPGTPKPKAPEPKPAAPPKIDVATLTARADAGDAEALYQLGFYFENTAFDLSEALKRYQAAAKKDNGRAMTRLGWLTMEGLGVRQDFKAAYQLFQKAYEKNVPLAPYYLGRMTYEGWGTTRSLQRANDWLEVSPVSIRMEAANGDPESQFAYSWMRATGMGAPKDLLDGCDWAWKAAKAGCIQAMVELGRIYTEKRIAKENYPYALKWFGKAAECGNPIGQYSMGLCHLCGWGVAADPAAAMSWFKKAADQKYAPALHEIGLLHLKGQGVPRNAEEGIRCLREAVDLGYTKSRIELGRRYASGDGPRRDPNQARKWFVDAAKAGDIDGYFQLGVLCEQAGRGAEAIANYVPAVRLGHDGAALNLGRMYLRGNGVKKNIQEAIKWLLMAVQMGNRDAPDALMEVNRQ